VKEQGKPMKVYTGLVQDVLLPEMVQVRQTFERPVIADIEQELRVQLSREAIRRLIKPEKRIALTAGSRGIANIALILKITAKLCHEKGAKPFIIPAMGSHGGATAEGQRDVLKGYGITEEACGCPILSTMETRQIGHSDEGYPILIDRYASEADGIIVIGRIKPHTCFRGEYESGLMKMMAIGLGKQQGAEVCHFSGFKDMQRLIPLFGNAIIKNAPVMFGIGLVENAYDETAVIRALLPDEIRSEEPKLLLTAKSLLGKILVTDADVLIVDKIGKNISGDGADPNITGRYGTPYASGGLAPQRMAVLDLTEESHGNANGLGLFDATTERLYRKINFDMTYPNSITCKMLNMLKIPVVMENDRDCIAVAVKSCYDIDYRNPRIVHIKDTMSLEYIRVSAALVSQVYENKQLEVIGSPQPFSFNEDGNLF
jgi:hypothetical protein